MAKKLSKQASRTRGKSEQVDDVAPPAAAVEKILDLPKELLNNAESAFKGRFKDEPSLRKIVRVAVQEELDEVVRSLTGAGLIYGASGNRKPRRIDASSWEALEKVALPTGKTGVVRKNGKVAVGNVALLRACLVRFVERQGQK